MFQVAPKKCEEKAKNLEVAVLSGLLDFHSDRAEAQASFVVACIFGSFALLTIVQNIENTILIYLSMIPYVMTSSIGFHCLIRFRYYANMAEHYQMLVFVGYVDMDKKHPRIYGWREHARTSEDRNKIPLSQYVKRLSRDFAGILGKLKLKKAWIVNLTALGFFGIPAFIVYFGQIFL